MGLDPHPPDHEAGSFFCPLWEREKGEKGITANWWTEMLQATKQVTISCKLQQGLSGTVA